MWVRCWHNVHLTSYSTNNVQPYMKNDILTIPVVTDPATGSIRQLATLMLSRTCWDADRV
jgi:hypothetical protein